MILQPNFLNDVVTYSIIDLIVIKEKKINFN